MQQGLLDVMTAPVDPSRPVTKSGFAERIGVSKGRVSQLITQGLPVRPDGKVDPIEAEAWLAENIDQRRRRCAPADQVDERPTRGRLPSVRGDIEAEKLRALRLENDRKAGETVDKAAAEAAIFARARLERDSHLAFVVRTAPVLAAEWGLPEAQVFAALDREVRRHLEQLADTPLEVLG